MAGRSALGAMVTKTSVVSLTNAVAGVVICAGGGKRYRGGAQRRSAVGGRAFGPENVLPASAPRRNAFADCARSDVHYREVKAP